jgi:predicted MFS family arabinose efflux permease
MVLTTAGTASAKTIDQLLLWRALAGISTGGVIPITLALLADLFPYEQRGRALGWIFGAIAGGMAFGSTLGALLNPYLGWRILFLVIASFQLLNFLVALRHRALLEGTRSTPPLTFAATMKSYLALLAIPRGFKTYFYIFFNGMFHSGVFAWLGSYLFARYRLSDPGIGLALLGYGIPGLLLGPAIGRAADRFGRRAIIPAGLVLSALSAALLILPIPLWLAAVLCTLLSMGLDMSHPLLAGIITTLDPARRGQAMGLNAFVLFIGFGLGSLAFQSLLKGENFTPPLAIFSSILFLLGLLAIPLFRTEIPPQK